MKGKSVVEKQISETANRKMGLLKDLSSKTAAFKQTSKKLGQRAVVESKLRHVEHVLEETFAAIEKPLLAASGFPEFAPSPESQQGYYLKKSPGFRSLCDMQRGSESRLTRKTRYVIVVDLAMDMAVYLPDVREELSKLMQETMLKQHSVLNIIKMGNKVIQTDVTQVEACFPTMPTRVDERTVLAVDKFINSLTKSKHKGGSTDFVEGFRKALLMKPDVVYLVSHTPPSAVRHQETCVKMIEDYFQALKDTGLPTDAYGHRPPAEFRYFAFRSPLAQPSHEQFFRQMCVVSADPDDPERVAEMNCVLTDREALWRSVLRDTKQAKKLRARLKRTAQVAETREQLRRVVPDLREKLHIEAAVEKLLRMDQEK
ncbi:serine:pyruvate/alanine:glyoxylate aminotransferase, partial [Neospora caninum Liverpool]